MTISPRRILTWIFLVVTLTTHYGCSGNNSKPHVVPNETHQKATESHQALTPLQSYAFAMQQKIERHWVKPTKIDSELDCEVQVLQAPGGIILDVTFIVCEGHSDEYRSSIERAILKAEPLPQPSDVTLFKKYVHLIFKPD